MSGQPVFRTMGGTFGLSRQPRQQQPRQEQKETPSIIPEWAYLGLPLIVDIICAAGFIPVARIAAVRALVMCALYREWVPTFLVFFLPRALPLVAICFVRMRWLSFWVSAKEHLKSTIATVAQTTNDNPLGGVGEVNNRRGESAAPAASGTSKGSGGVEVRGYDVSAVNGDEVVELSSWTNTTSPNLERPGARRRKI